MRHEHGAWPHSAAELQAYYNTQLLSSNAAVLFWPTEAEFWVALIPFLERLKARKQSGHILVKTSTAGQRPLQHEFSPTLLSTTLKAIREVFSNEVVLLGDGTAFGSPYLHEAQKSGYVRAAQEYGAQLCDLNDKVVGQCIHGLPISHHFTSAGAVVNLSRAKTHRRFGISAASKALLGAICGSETGYPKLLGRHHLVPQLVHSLAEASPPHVSLVDGITGVEGNGPLMGTPVSSGFLIMCDCYYSTDVQVSLEMGFEPLLVPGLIRKLPSPATGAAFSYWKYHRISSHDFIPPNTCPWLYRSLVLPSFIKKQKFALLLKAIARCSQ